MATSGRYQSRLFSFFSEQSLRLRDRTIETWRRVKIAAAWSTQIALYPIYLAFQSTRLVGKQLRQTTRQVLPQLRAANRAIQNPDVSASPASIIPSSDTPIQNILQTAIHLTQALPAAQNNCTGDSRIAPTHPLLQGIASLLETQSLILVSTDNQLLDILTPDQQTQLYRRMVWELADYYHQQQTLGLKQPAALKSLVVNNFLPLPADRPNALLPIRVFYGLMAWVQTSPVAIAANLFQESRLASLHTAKLSGSQSAPQLPDSSGDGLRSAELAWLPLKEIFGDRTAPKSSSNAPSSPLLVRLLNWFKPNAIERVPPSDSQVLQASRSDRSSQSNQFPWLTVEDLFGRIQPFQTQNASGEWELHDTAHSNRLVKHKASTLKTSDPAQPIAASSATATLSQLDNSTAENDLTLSITTIEAEVSLVTYVKHPLEQVLEWLDRGMLWLEEQVAKVLGWWRDRLNGGK